MKFLDFLNESSVINKSEHTKIETHIVDACREFKVSIRSVEFENDTVIVNYNHGEEAPKNYISDKSEARSVVKEEVTEILEEIGLRVKSSSNTNTQAFVGTITFYTEQTNATLPLIYKEIKKDTNLHVTMSNNKDSIEIESDHDGEIYHIKDDANEVYIYEKDVDQYSIPKKGKSAKIIADLISKKLESWK